VEKWDWSDWGHGIFFVCCSQIHSFCFFLLRTCYCRCNFIQKGPDLFLYVLHGGSFNTLDFLTLCFDGGETGRVEVQCKGMLLMFVSHCVLRKPTISLQSEPMLPLNLFPEQVEKRKRKEVHDPFEH